MDHAAATGDWLSSQRRFLAASALGHLVWEIGQLPLYTIWSEGTTRDIVVAAIHCTGGDILIAGASPLVALMLLGNARWPHSRFKNVALAAIVGGVGYTIFSEWLNTDSQFNIMQPSPGIGASFPDGAFGGYPASFLKEVFQLPPLTPEGTPVAAPERFVSARQRLACAG